MSAADDTNYATLLGLYGGVFINSPTFKFYTANAPVSGSANQIARAFSMIDALAPVNLDPTPAASFQIARTYFEGTYPNQNDNGPVTPLGKNNRIVIIGDSLIENGSNALNGRRNNRNILLHAFRKLGQPYRVVAQNGHGGFNTEALFNLWDTEIAPYNPGIIGWESGTNDFNGGVSSKVAFARLRAAHNRAKLEGRRFVYIGMPPLYYNGDAAEFIQRVRQLAREDSTFEYTGGAERLLEYNGTPTQLGVPTLKTNAAPDLTHPSAYGARLWSDAIVDYFTRRGIDFAQPFSSVINSGVVQSANYLNNIVVNGLVGAASVGFSASVAPAATRTAVSTNVAMGTTGLQAFTPGRLFQTVWSPGTGPSATDVMSSANISDRNGDFAQYVGRKFVARAYIKATATGGVIHDVHLRAVGYSWDYSKTAFDVADNKSFDLTSLPTWSLNATDYEGVFETDVFTVGSTNTPTQCHAVSYANISAAAGATVTVQVGAMEIVEVFDL